jgi:uncharacterized membrane protein YidH (DUF202 family)
MALLATSMPNQPTDEPLEPQPASAGQATLDAGDLRSVERLLKALQTSPADPFVLPQRESPREEPPAFGAALQTWAMQPLPGYPAMERRDGFLAWLFLSLGLMAFACGAAMLVWSVMESREELWSYGIPLVLGGQGAVIFGLIGLAENAAQRQKQTAAALDEHRQRLTLMQNLALTSQALPARRAA